MLIGGNLVEAGGGRRYDVRAPADGKVLASAPDATGSDVESAIGAQLRAGPEWAALAPADRAETVRRLAATAERHAGELAALDSLDTGVPLWMTRADVRTGIQRMRMFADWALRLTGETVPASGTHLSYTEQVPFGAVARIIAYNHPAMFALSKVAAPLVAGNTVILKPSELTPLSALRLGALWADSVPPGVFSVLSGATPAPSIQLVEDPRVRRIAFTGSPRTGRAIQRAAAEHAVKSVSLELGGKNALVVLPDADLDAVVAGAVRGMNLAFAGQSCGSTSRLLVPRRLAGGLVDALAAEFAAVRLGPPELPGAGMGPLITRQHRDRVLDRIAHSRSRAARVVTGGGVPGRLADGFFAEPTLVLEPDPASALATEEIFGPVLTVIPVEDTAQAVTVANSVRFGLSASVYGRDLARTLGVARQMEAGYVWVNDTSTHFPGVPFGGQKDSGVGREESFEELLGYTQPRATSVRRG
nr:aldehyde dehydrogenase family protein [Amycolatopsis rubida]